MLKIIIVEFLTKDLVFVREDNIVHMVDGDDSEIVGVKSKNIVINNFLAKSKFLIKPKPKVGFLTLIGKLEFRKLRQAFIKSLILSHFDLKYPIWIKTDILDYVISRVLSQLTLDKLNQ